MSDNNGMSLDSLKDETGQNPHLENLKQHNIELSRANKKLEQAVANEDRIFDRMCQNIEAWPEIPFVDYKRPEGGETSKLEAIMVVTDEHAEETVESAEMEGLNWYNWQTYLARQWQYLSVCMWLIRERRKTATVDKLHFWSLGDQVTGEIHQEDLIGNEFSMPDAVPNVANVKAQMLRQLAHMFPEVHFTGIVGNHARTTKKKVFKKTAERNWDRGIYRLMQMMLTNQTNINWNIPKSVTDVVNVAGWDCFLMHGDQVNMNSRTPYYPIESTLQREQGMRHQAKRWFDVLRENMSDGQKEQFAEELPDVEFDYAFMGHFHHRFILSDSIFGCPSPVGANTFSKQKIHAMSLPRMMLFFVHRREGIIDERPINLMGASEHGFTDPAVLYQ